MAWNFTMKVVLFSSCVVLTALAMGVSIPLALEFMASHVPLVWSSVLSWLRPPYLYVVINGIIISIAASSRFHHRHDHEKLSATTSVSDDHRHHHYDHLGYDDRDDQAAEVTSPEFRMLDRTVVVYQRREEELGSAANDDHVKTVVSMNDDRPADAKDDDHDDHYHDGEELVMVSMYGRSESSPPKRIIDEPEDKMVLFSTEKPLGPATSGDRKPVKSSPEGKQSLKAMSNPKRHETMDNTWKKIMESRSMSLSRNNLKRSSWDYSDMENQGRQIIGFGDDLDQPHQAPSPMTMRMKKSETFKDRTNQQPPPVATTASKALWKEPSLSQDELNKRVEAFINKFNEQMRLQRQESLNQYLEMINRRSH